MEFSPFSPKIFLTYGTDWYIRIWIEGITQPIIELLSGFEPIQSAHWCPNNSTIIACTTKSKLNIWNIRKSILKPASTQVFESPLTICRYFMSLQYSLLTPWNLKKKSELNLPNENDETSLFLQKDASWYLFSNSFSKCGRSLVFGMSDGSTHFTALEVFPLLIFFSHQNLPKNFFVTFAKRICRSRRTFSTMFWKKLYTMPSKRGQIFNYKSKFLVFQVTAKTIIKNNNYYYFYSLCEHFFLLLWETN